VLSPLGMHAELDQPTLRMTPADPQQHRMAIPQITSDAFAGRQYDDEINMKFTTIHEKQTRLPCAYLWAWEPSPLFSS